MKIINQETQHDALEARTNVKGDCCTCLFWRCFHRKVCDNWVLAVKLLWKAGQLASLFWTFTAYVSILQILNNKRKPQMSNFANEIWCCFGLEKIFVVFLEYVYSSSEAL